MKVIAVIQARIHSERLPDKVLMELPYGHGKPLLKWINESIEKSEMINKCVVATSVNKGNEKITNFCENHGYEYIRGSEEDVLSRFITITRAENADVVIRLTGDNPILDIDILDQAISRHIEKGVDFTQTFGLPLGMNFEIMSGKALLSIDDDVTKEEKEHVTYYFKIRDHVTTHEIDLNTNNELADLRVTVDYPEDYLVVSHLLSNLRNGEIPSLSLVERVYEQTPWIFKVNSDKTQVKVFPTIEEEKKEAIRFLRRVGFEKSANIFENK